MHSLSNRLPLKAHLSVAICFTFVTAISAIQPSGASPLPTEPGWDSGFDGNRALGHVRVLASDSLRGRYSGFAGADKANLYIASHFDKLELEAPWGRDGYLHRFTYGAGEYTMPSGLVAHYPDGATDTAHFWRDLNVFKYSGFGKVHGKVVLVGNGISSPENGWDDYAGIDVKGAVVLAWRGVPHVEGKDFGSWGMSGRKSSFALEKGAAGFIYCESDPPKWATIMDENFREELPAVWVSKSFADLLLKQTGKTKDQWKQLGDSTKASVSRSLDVEVSLEVSGKYYPKRKTQNLGGLLLGSDPILRNEIVVIGAHMDHHGVDPAGNLYPGADDNASGTAAMMELAEVFAQQKERPKRTIMFVGFACEEEGLYGSKAFVDEARLPKGMSVVAMLNMDMVGQGNCSLGVGGISEFPLLGEACFKSWTDSAQKQLDFWGLYDGSDHASFRDAGIPAYVIGARGDHPNYHTPGDSAANINPAVLKAVGDMMFQSARALADHPGSVKSFSGRGRWLVNLYGGLKFESAFVGQRGEAGVDTILIWPRGATRISGVDYQFPITIVSVERKPGVGGKEAQPHSMVEEWIDRLPFEWILNICEQVLARDEDGSYPALDLTKIAKKSEEEIEGSILATRNLTRIPIGKYPPETLQALQRLGVGFDALTIDYTFAAPSNQFGATSPEAIQSVLKLSSDFIRRTGMRPLFTFGVDSLGSNSRFIEIVAASAGFWKQQAICRIEAGNTNLKDIQKLVESGLFVYLESLDKLSPKQQDELTEFLKVALKSNVTNLGIAPDASFIDRLLLAGIAENDIGALLALNVRRTLKKWWGSDEYSNSMD